MSSGIGWQLVVDNLQFLIQLLNQLFLLSIASLRYHQSFLQLASLLLVFPAHFLQLRLQLFNRIWELLFSWMQPGWESGWLSFQSFNLWLLFFYCFIELRDCLLWFSSVAFDDLIESWLIHRWWPLIGQGDNFALMELLVIGTLWWVHFMNVGWWVVSLLVLGWRWICHKIERFLDQAVHVGIATVSKKCWLDTCIQVLLECIIVLDRIIGLVDRLIEFFFEFLDFLVEQHFLVDSRFDIFL